MSLTNSYLVQRINSASPEQLMAIIMEAGQLYLGRAVRSIEQKNFADMATNLGRVIDAINEASLRLNYEDRPEVVDNLEKIYNWWTIEILAVSASRNTDKLREISSYMEELRGAWEAIHTKKYNFLHNPESTNLAV